MNVEIYHEEEDEVLFIDCYKCKHKMNPYDEMVYVWTLHEEGVYTKQVTLCKGCNDWFLRGGPAVAAT